MHGALSTIDGSFGPIIAGLARTHRVIAIEQQAHGRTADIERPVSYPQMADDTAELLRLLGVRQADVFGFSMGAVCALELAFRHPGLVRKLAIASGCCNEGGYIPELARFMRDLDAAQSAESAHPLGPERLGQLEQRHRLVAPKPRRWQNALSRTKQAFHAYSGLDWDQVRSIRAHTLVVGGDDDVVYPKHMSELAQFIPHGRLHLLPDTRHTDVVVRAAPLLPAFFDEPLPR
jgi:pimeloyl-ACP methyl ester carboxylesterase